MRSSLFWIVAGLALIANACHSESGPLTATPPSDVGSGSSRALTSGGAPTLARSAPMSTARAGAAGAQLGVDWRRGFDGTYSFNTYASASIVRVQYVLDGALLGIAAADAAMHVALPSGESHALTVIGFDERGLVAAIAHGMIDVTDGPGISVRPVATNQYEVRLERAGDVNAIEVDVDGATVTDLESGARQSGRHAVRGLIATRGHHSVTVATFIESGVPRGILQRTFVID